MRAVFRAATIIAAVVLGCFAVANRQAASLALWPLPYVVELPLYLLVFGVLLVGFIVGVLAAWLGARQRRRELRRRGRQIEALERELAATQSQLVAAAPNPEKPALPERG
jgi:lipopolysaccharide assembly protein A